MEQPAAISIRNLVKRYAASGNAPPKLALDDVSFDVPQGHIFGLLGPNGAVKAPISSQARFRARAKPWKSCVRHLD